MVEILFKNNYTCFHNQVINSEKVPIEKFKIIYFAKKNWNKIRTEK
jgi:hypothetical protein